MSYYLVLDYGGDSLLVPATIFEYEFVVVENECYNTYYHNDDWYDHCKYWLVGRSESIIQYGIQDFRIVGVYSWTYPPESTDPFIEYLSTTQKD